MLRPTSYDTSRFAPQYPSGSHVSPASDENTTYHGPARAVSAKSCLSTGSVIRRPVREPLRARDVNAISSSVSLSTFNFADGSKTVSQLRKLPSQLPCTSGRATDIHPSQGPRGNIISREADGINYVDLTAGNDELQRHSSNTTYDGVLNDASSPKLSGDVKYQPMEPYKQTDTQYERTGTQHDDKLHPFRRWVSTLRRRNVNLRQPLTPTTERYAIGDFETSSYAPPAPPRSDKHRKSSSSGFVTAMKSTTASLIALSAAPPIWTTRPSFVLRRNSVSSGMSTRFNRGSVEGCPPQIDTLDEASKQRALQRRETIDEIISSEENYIADLKVLVNVYFTLLVTAPTVTHKSISHIHNNITEILTLHENLLAQLICTMRRWKGLQENHVCQYSEKPIKYTRWRSSDGTTNKRIDDKYDTGLVRRSFDLRAKPSSGEHQIVCEPKETADIAMIFENMMSQFFVYEEYGARYESMLSEISSTFKAIPNIQIYERGIEALANTLAPISTRDGISKKGLTFGDLLIKPIQRICKYPLLFSDLLRYTPVIDCPESHLKLEKVLYRLRELADEINRATNDHCTRDRIQRSWRLQDLLSFPLHANQTFALRLLGYPILCGVLHVAYQSQNSVSGKYMLCALFRTSLILGIPNVAGRTYSIVASISLNSLRIEPTDSGKGLQCYTALYSWKIIFEANRQVFELILSACSSQEEEIWKSHLLDMSSIESKKSADRQNMSPEKHSLLWMDLRSVGSVLGKPGTLVRRMSIQRAATVGSKTNLYQIIIKNTHALRENTDRPTFDDPSMNRSQSLISTNSRIPILAPKRIERIRMEHDLSKVWTKDLLQYPGMGGTRGDHILRASASSMMRKLSRASLTTGFSKRSASHASIGSNHFTDIQNSLPSVVNLENGQTSVIRISSNDGDRTDQANKHGTSNLHCIPLRRSSASKIPMNFTQCQDNSIHFESTETVEGSKVYDIFTSRPAKTSKARWHGPLSLFRSISTDGLKTFRTSQNSAA